MIHILLGQLLPSEQGISHSCSENNLTHPLSSGWIWNNSPPPSSYLIIITFLAITIANHHSLLYTLSLLDYLSKTLKGIRQSMYCFKHNGGHHVLWKSILKSQAWQVSLLSLHKLECQVHFLFHWQATKYPGDTDETTWPPNQSSPFPHVDSSVSSWNTLWLVGVVK